MDTLPNDKALVIFDGVCNLCSSSVQFIIKHDKHDYFRFASLQSELGILLVKQYDIKNDSVILIENGSTFEQSSAALRIAKRLSGGYKLLSVFLIVPKFLRDFIYKIVAKYRYSWFGKKEACWLPNKEINKKFLN